MYCLTLTLPVLRWPVASSTLHLVFLYPSLLFVRTAVLSVGVTVGLIGVCKNRGRLKVTVGRGFEKSGSNDLGLPGRVKFIKKDDLLIKASINKFCSLWLVKSVSTIVPSWLLPTTIYALSHTTLHVLLVWIDLNGEALVVVHFLGILFAITFAVRCMDVTGLVSYGKAQ